MADLKKVFTKILSRNKILLILNLKRTGIIHLQPMEEIRYFLYITILKLNKIYVKRSAQLIRTSSDQDKILPIERHLSNLNSKGSIRDIEIKF